MREHLRRFFIYSISGFGLVLGMALAVFVIDWLKAKDEPTPLQNCQPFKNNGEILVKKVDPITVTSFAGVRVSLMNSSKTDTFKPSDPRLFIMHEGKILFECGGYGFSAIPPNQLVTVQFMCREVERNLLPPDVEYQVTVDHITPANSCGEWHQTIVRD